MARSVSRADGRNPGIGLQNRHHFFSDLVKTRDMHFVLLPFQRWLLVGSVCFICSFEKWRIHRKKQQMREEEWKNTVKQAKKLYERELMARQVAQVLQEQPVKEEPKEGPCNVVPRCC